MSTRLHRVPLTDAALHILLALKELNTEWVFPRPRRRRPYSASGMRDLLKKMHRTDIWCMVSGRLSGYGRFLNHLDSPYDLFLPVLQAARQPDLRVIAPTMKKGTD